MKKLLLLLMALPSIGFCDTKISALASTTTLNAQDIIPVVTNPLTSPANFSITKSNLLSTLGVIQNQSTLQTGAVFNVATGTINGPFLVTSTGTTVPIKITCNGLVGGGNSIYPDGACMTIAPTQFGATAPDSLLIDYSNVADNQVGIRPVHIVTGTNFNDPNVLIEKLGTNSAPGLQIRAASQAGIEFIDTGLSQNLTVANGKYKFVTCGGTDCMTWGARDGPNSSFQHGIDFYREGSTASWSASGDMNVILKSTGAFGWTNYAGSHAWLMRPNNTMNATYLTTLPSGYGSANQAWVGDGAGNVNYTNVILGTSALQSGATFYVSSGTVNGPLTITSGLAGLKFLGNSNLSNLDQSIDYWAQTGALTNRVLLTNSSLFSNPQTRAGWNFQDASGNPIVTIPSVNASSLGNIILWSTGAVAFYDGSSANAVVIQSSTTNTNQHTLVLPRGAATSTNSFVNVSGINGNVEQLQFYNLLGGIQTWTGQNNWTTPSPSSFTYAVNVGSVTGGGLTACGDSTHGLGYSSSNQFTCQNITGTGGSGGSSTLGFSSGSATVSVVVSSPTTNIVVDSNTFIASLQGLTSSFLQLNSSSVTLQGNNLGATYLTNSSATATYLQLSSATATYLQSSSATATYLQSSSATVTYLQASSATATYLQNSSASVTYATLKGTQTFTGGNTFSSATVTSLVVTSSAVIPSNSQNFGRSTLNQWFSQMASLQTPFSPLSTNKLGIVLLGDSHMAKNVETGPFIDWLYSNFGNAGTYFPLSDNGESDNTMRPNGCTYSKTGSWVTNQNSPTALGLDDDSMHTSTPTATILGTCPQTDMVILHYTLQPNGGTVDFSVDGANHMVLPTANATTIVASATISGLSYGVHTASVSYTTSGSAGIDVLDWVFFSTSTPGAIVYRAGSNAQRADMYVAQNATQYQNLLAMLPSTPSVVMVALDVNDAASAIVPAIFVSNVETIVQRFRNVYPNIDCAYQSEPDFQNSANDLYPMSAYENGLLKAAVQDNCSFTDFTAYFSTFPQFNQYYSDTIHLNKQGGQVAAQLFINTFSNNVNTITPFTYNASSNVVTWGTDITTTSASNFASLGSNIQISSGITNSGAIGTNLTVTKSNSFLIGGAAGSGAEQTLTVATITASALAVTGGSGESVTYGLTAGSVTANNVNGVTQCLHASASGLITGTGSDCLGSGSVINNFQPGFLQMAHGHNFTYGVNSTTYMVVGNASLEQLSVEAEAQVPFRSSGTLRGLWVMVNANSLTSGSTVTLRINGSNASEQVFIPAGSIGEFQDTAHMDFINVGDKVDYQLQTGASGTSLLLYGMAVVFSPTQNNVMKMISTGQPYGSTTNGLATYYHTITGLLDLGNIYESTVSYRTKTAGTFANLTVDVSSNSRPGATVVRFRKNGANGNEVVTIPAGSSGTYTDSVNVDNVVVGDTVDYQTTMDGNVSVAGSSVAWIGSEFTTTGNQVDYVAPTLGHFFNPGDANIWPVLSYGGSDSAEINSFQAKSQVPMVCSNLHVYLSSNSLNQPITIVFRKNQANGNQALVIPSGSWGYFEDTFSTHTDIVSPGDEIDWKDTVPAGAGTAPFNYIAMTCKILPNIPGGINQQIGFNDNGTLGGSPLFTFDKSSGAVTATYGVIAGTFTSTGLNNMFINGVRSQSLDTQGGLLDVFKTNASGGGGDLLIGIGSNQQADQIQIKDQTALGLTRYGANIGGLQIGLAAATQKVGTNQTGNNFLEVWNSGNMNLSTDVGANNDVVIKPGATENVRISNTSGMTVTSSETNKSVNGIGLTAGPLNLGSQAAPAFKNGNVWQDSTQNSLRYTVSGATQIVNGTLWTMTVSSSINNVATERSIISTQSVTGVGTLSLPANFFTIGKSVYFVLSGTYTTTGTPTLDIKVKLNGVTVLDSGIVTLTAVTGTDVFTLSGHMTCRTTGASGTVMAVGQTVQNTSTIASAGMDLNSTLSTVDTTAIQGITVTVTWSAASASNNLTFTNGFVNVLN